MYTTSTSLLLNFHFTHFKPRLQFVEQVEVVRGVLRRLGLAAGRPRLDLGVAARLDDGVVEALDLVAVRPDGVLGEARSEDLERVGADVLRQPEQRPGVDQGVDRLLSGTGLDEDERVR